MSCEFTTETYFPGPFARSNIRRFSTRDFKRTRPQKSPATANESSKFNEGSEKNIVQTKGKGKNIQQQVLAGVTHLTTNLPMSR
jgi:hypothetical protein